jgi:hypothetical protein
MLKYNKKMGDLSYHFNHRDFTCKCSVCQGKEYKIHLGLVGLLEFISEHFRKRINVLSGYWCDAYMEALKSEKRSYHNFGKAAHISIPGVTFNELFKFAETVEGIFGIGFYPQKGFVHIDTRPKEKAAKWVKEGNNYLPLTQDLRNKYKL